MDIPNPSAFPIQANKSSGMMAPEYGMTLRDWFAGQALVGMLSHDGGPIASTQRGARETLARYAYGAADAMLAQRAEASNG